MTKKTKKSVKKRFKITKKQNLLHQKSGQDHFNARESGKVTRNKRKPKKLPKGYAKTIRQII
ncbi:50S ribosomal protein L35 [bacterium]|nr:50S ribosomal protein L35 [bacterium]